MDNQRLLLYVSLALVLYLIWQAWEQDYGPRPAPQAAQTKESPSADTARDVPEGAPLEASSRRSRNEVSTAASERIHVKTDVLDVEIDTRGGDIRRAALLAYPAQASRPNEPFILLHDDAEHGLYIAQSGLIHAATAAVEATELAPSHHAIYTADKRDYRLRAGQDELRVPLTWRSGAGIAVRKVFTFHRGDYLVDVTHTVANRSAETWNGQQYRQLRHGPIRAEETSRLLYTYAGAAYFDASYHKISFDDMEGEALGKEITGGWAAMLEHYFVSAWTSEPKQANFYYTNVIRGGSQPEYIIGLRSDGLAVPPRETGAFHAELFVGPKLQDRLGEIANGLELTVDYGIFTVLAKPLFWLLNFIYEIIGNWGWAIVILTMLIKLVFYKLSETSYKSMAKMRAVQPRMTALRDRHGGDKQKMNQALMELYKTEKINPLGGCLPIVVQIPVFIALYWMLLESVEMRQADFILWINDLSSKDPYFVLPLLMGVTMFVQQRLNPAPMDPIQAKMMMALPFVFTVFFAFFPAGLVLYWLVNNLLSIAQQWVITKRIEGAIKAA